MKIIFAASAGGHLTELLMIANKKVIGKNDKIILSEKTDRTKNLSGKVYFFEALGYNPVKYILPLLRCMKILKREKVKLILTTGAEVGLVAIIAGRLLGIKSVFIEIAGNPKTPSLGGRMAYLFSNVFLVQYPELAKKFGRKAKYVGGII
ncbi:hypothetical protein COU62_03800 [Candidatus Pacearchaeota archaeon CG10_big_fil_rev_8_21_14_0_10_35_219]|nr:hypothetical protein [Candidatus Pacearchaeota archaeon]OIO42291.1 MAG: hypothetical protein AUJ63_03370 [Candidatus Pacearchaeota archaeon CG1_02_35_32]PIO07475.1 MAG: hypothetical protein COU62_03800 [Candidatus Pacearchaeota archaeon CG10_big_fil_rev_8_21_14_0_10_35_219]PIY81281.1 MAG: hypothetical protein COY79_03295 [Candidatus Pacearchaeota archaeon CG_4_10_14_0_8_um_filter_35_169]PIZ80210.1 MAG: hypothetical protein COY00_01940 [Candidatus Pacearchaeota archaeon CG_4_10_14_0_2_um_filt